MFNVSDHLGPAPVKRVQVRSSRKPGKLLGFLAIPAGVQVGDGVRFVSPRGDLQVELQLSRCWVAKRGWPHAALELVSALRSSAPVETLRQLPGWEEAPRA